MLEQTENLPILAFSLAPVCKYIRNYFGGRHSSRRRDLPQRRVLASATRTTTSRCTSRYSSKASWSPGPRSRAIRPISAAPSPGGYNPNAVEVWQEALRIPPVKVYEKGQATQGCMGPDLRQHPLRYRAARHEGGDRRVPCRRAPNAGAPREVRPCELRSAQAGAVRCDAQDDGKPRSRPSPTVSTAAKAGSITTAGTRARNLLFASPSRSRTSASGSITRKPMRRPTASSTARSLRAPRRRS